MICCLNCGIAYQITLTSFLTSLETPCNACGFVPATERDVVAFAPQLAYENEGYDPKWYQTLASLEEGNFWFGARNQLISWVMRKYAPQLTSFLEVGCGSGFVLRAIATIFPRAAIYASEICVDGLTIARQRLQQRAVFFQMDGLAIPFIDEFAAIGAFDVIEHIKDDSGCLMQMYRALKQSGLLVLTVPQHKWLWSKYDELGHHFRRYSKAELVAKIQQAGFKVLYTNSYNSLLLPLLCASRAINKFKTKQQVDVLDELKIGKLINSVLRWILALEITLTKFGVRWPLGGSLLLVAKKP